MSRRTHIFIVAILVFLTLLFMNTAVVTGLGGDFSCKLVFKPFHGLHGVYSSETVAARPRGFRGSPPWSVDSSRYTLLLKHVSESDVPYWWYFYAIGFIVYVAAALGYLCLGVFPMLLKRMENETGRTSN